jgi:hypothetical protein
MKDTVEPIATAAQEYMGGGASPLAAIGLGDTTGMMGGGGLANVVASMGLGDVAKNIV